jgi:multidrug transporter EmrE-like cation transporter
MKSWLYLLIAIVSEVAATSALKASDGFRKLVPSAVVVVGYGPMTSSHSPCGASRWE